MRHCRTLLHAGIMLTQNGSRDILRGHSLAIVDGRIAAIGPTPRMLADWTAEEELDFGDMLVMPGLVNSHCHAAMTFLRGLADDMPLMEWLERKVFPVEARLTAEITRLGSLLGYAEMLASGVTSCVDMYIFEDAAFGAASLAGLRLLGGEAVFAFPSAACASHHEALEATRRLAERFKGHERLSVAVNPHSVYTTTPEILKDCRDLALELDLPLHIHLAETREETARCLAERGLRPVAYCDSLGLADCGLIAAHLVDIEPGEARLLAARGARGVHNPSSNMKLASGAAPVSAALAGGLTMGLGTDGPASNNSLSMFSEMGRAALLAKLASGDPAALPAQTVLDMATLGGGSVLGIPGLGSLVEGAPADCVALDMSLPNMQPMHNPVSQIVYAASGQECRMSMVAGEVLYLDGRFSRFDYESLLEDVRKLGKFAARYVN